MNIVGGRFKKGIAGLSVFLEKRGAKSRRLMQEPLNIRLEIPGSFKTRSSVSPDGLQRSAPLLSYAPNPSEISHLPSKSGHC